jgi:hypothetical protein
MVKYFAWQPDLESLFQKMTVLNSIVQINGWSKKTT